MKHLAPKRRSLTHALLLVTGMTLWYTPPAHAAALPKYIISKILSLIEGAVEDTAGGFITREGTSEAKAGAVWMDYGIALEANWYADAFGNHRQTIQQNHLQGEEHVGGGFELLDRKFAYHDWSVWLHDSEDPLADPILNGDYQRIAGNGLHAVVNDEDTWIGEGTLKYWNAKYVVFSEYSNTGSEGLRRPSGNFNLKIEFILADLNYSVSEGLVSSERNESNAEYVSVSKIQKDKITNVDLLEPNSEIVSGPSAYGKCKRVWKLKIPEKTADEWFVLSLNPKALVDVLINEHEWIVHEFQIDYGWSHAY